MAFEIAPLAIGAGSSLLGGLFGGNSGEAEILRKLKAIEDDYGNLSLPDLDAYKFSPEEYRASLIQENPALQARQEALLGKLSELSDTGMSEADMAGYRMANQQANQAARQNSAALRDEARRRGAGGSGLEFALREQANQDALTRGQNMGLQQSADSARQRALYNTAYGDLLSGVRGQDLNAKSANADIINRFNQLNTSARNDANLGNMQRRNEIAQQNYQNQLSKLSGKAGAVGETSKGLAASGAASSARSQNMFNTITQGALAGAGYGPWAQRKKIGEE